MAQDALHTTLDTLRSERNEAELRTLELRGQLMVVTQRLANLNGAIENIEALLGVESEDDRAVLDEDGVPVREEQGSLKRVTNHVAYQAQVEQDGRIFTIDVPTRKRVPSTDWVAEAVNAIGEPADRDTIFAKFEEMRGIPESWVANPRNSFNNALGRAVERHLILKFGENEFAPQGYNPFRDEPETSGEGSS